MSFFQVQSGTQTIAALGENNVVTLAKSALVKLLPIAEKKIIEVWGAEQEIDPELDFMLEMQNNKDDVYPNKQTEFNQNYEVAQVTLDGTVLFRKNSFRAVRVPEGTTLHVFTRESAGAPEVADYGCYVGIDNEDCVYVISEQSFNEAYSVIS